MPDAVPLQKAPGDRQKQGVVRAQAAKQVAESLQRVARVFLSFFANEDAPDEPA